MSPAADPAGAATTHTGSLVDPRSAVPRMDLSLRNYDRRPDTVELVASDDDGVAAERECCLDPGELFAERRLLPPGTYDVTARLRLGKRDTATCRVGDDPADTIRVEVGNHVVAVSEGVD